MKKRPKNRGRKFSGSALRIEQRILNGKGRWYIDQKIERSGLSRVGGVSLHG